jgi:hypothetical protein
MDRRPRLRVAFVEELFRMPRYYFHIKRGQVTILDHEGIDLFDLAAAEKEALRRGREIVTRDGPSNGGTIVVADHNWQRLFELPF